MKRGETVSSGLFFRNLKKDQVALNYERQPEFGHRLKKLNHWNWTNASGQMELSVNLVSCILTPACSIRVHPKPDTFEHVWEMDLDVLNEWLADSEDSCVAQYEPVPPNECHFVIMSLEGVLSPTQIIALLERLARNFPPEGAELPKPKCLPRGSEAAAERASDAYRRLVKLHLSPLKSS